jgi:hypothetical protein
MPKMGVPSSMSFPKETIGPNQALTAYCLTMGLAKNSILVQNKLFSAHPETVLTDFFFPFWYSKVRLFSRHNIKAHRSRE